MTGLYCFMYSLYIIWFIFRLKRHFFPLEPKKMTKWTKIDVFKLHHIS